LEAFAAIRTVLAVRRFQGTPVPAEVRGRIVEAGRLSGSSINRQPWHFVVIEERDTLRQVGAIMKSGPYIATASFAVVVLVEKDSPYAVSDASRAIQNMILTGWSEGVGSNWVGFGPMPAVETLLGVPRSFECVGIVPFGFPVAKLGQGKKNRKPLGEVASHERFGIPFA